MKIGICAPNPGFVTGLYGYLKDKYDVSYCTPLQVEEYDIVWSDFCYNHVVELSKVAEKTKLIVRFLGGDVLDPWKFKVNWKQVSHIVFLSDYLKTLYESMINNDVPKTVIGLDINCNRFAGERKTYGKNICIVGYIQSRKNHIELVDMLRPKFSAGWKLNIKGKRAEDDDGIEYNSKLHDFITEHKLEEVSFADWGELEYYFSDQDIIVSSSKYEGFHKALAEGMSAGCYPLIADWGGAGKIYSPDFIYHSHEEFLKKLDDWEVKTQEQKQVISKEIAQLVSDRYNAQWVYEKIEKLIIKTVGG